MAKVSPLLLVPLVIFAAFAGLALSGLFREDPDALPSTLQGRPAPVVQVAPLGDLPLLSDAELRSGGVKVVNFWASWCAPCRAEHASLMKLAEAGVPVFGVNYKDQPENAQGFLRELGNPYQLVGADPDGRMAIEWGVYGVPETFVIDGAGTVVLRFAGPITQRTLDGTILPAIDAARGGS